MSDSPTHDPAAPDPSAPTVEPYQSEAVDRVRKMMDAAPTQIGRYRILEKLGGGGMGEVYRAEQRVPVRREVAIKLIKLGMDTKLVIARFEAERQALAMMDHPHIAKVYDADADETGRPYFVMEYVKGRPITEYADTNHLTITERLQLFEQVCHAIQHAHHKGIIHRDLKPGNVLVSTQDGRPHAKVIDFGIAKATSQRLTDLTLYTQHDQFIGTPQYMSPEQADGSLDIDTRTDVYSLGVLLYELLTGSTPFASSEMRAAAMEQIRKMIREVDPPKPSTRLNLSQQTLPSLAASRRVEPKKLGLLLRGELDWIVMKALEKDRARRYGTPDSLVDDVQRFLSGEPVVAAPPTWTYRARKFIRKHRGPVIAVGTIGLTLLAGIAGTTCLAIFAKRQQAIAVAQTARADEAAAREAQRAEQAEFDAYAASLAAAQGAIQGNSWPEARRRLNAASARHRGFEWAFLQRQANVFQYTLPGEYRQVAVGPGGKRVLTVSDRPHGVRVWDAATGRPVGQAMEHAADISCASFSPDGRLVLTGCEDGFARLWDTDTGLNVGKPMKIGYAVGDAAFSADGRRILIIARWGLAQLWDAQTTHPVGRPLLQGGQRSGAEFTPNGRLVGTLEGDGIAKLWNAETGQLLFRLPTPLGGSASSMFTPDSRYALLQGSDVKPRLWNTQTGEAQELTDLPVGLHPVAISPDSNRIACLTSEGSIRFLDLTTGRPTGLTIRCPRDVREIQYSPDGRTLRTTLTDSASGHLWDTVTGRPISERSVATVYTPESFDSPDQQTLQWINASTFGLFDSYGKPRATISTHRAFAAARWIDRGRSVLFEIAERDGMGPSEISIARADELHTPRQLFAADRDAGVAVEVALDGESKTAVANPKFQLRFGPDGGIEVDADGKSVATLIGHSAGNRVAAFTPDGRRLVTAGEDRTLRFWDTTRWQVLAVFPVDGMIQRLRFSPDGTRLAIELADGSAEIWDTRPVADARQDLLADAAERNAAEQDVSTLLASNTPTGKLVDAVRHNPSLSPRRKQAVLGQLREAIKVLNEQAAALVNQVPNDSSWASRRAVAKTIAEPRLAALVRAKLRAAHGNAWDYVISKDNPVSEYQAIRDDLREAVATDNENYNALAYVSLRLGQPEETIALLNRPEAINPENRPLPAGERRHMADWAFLAMAHLKLGHAEEAARCADRFLQAYATTDESRIARYRNLRNELVSIVSPTTRPG